VPNRLATETSPYLLQHKDNPVDWYPWSEEALERARTLQRPLLVSIGYSACHWCHVMEHESFEDPAIAELMNERFVCIKVDREERPDVDAVLMEACQAITGQGGWPLNAFLTPAQAPFYVGTYFPPQSRQGIPSWRAVLEAVSSAWTDRREDVLKSSSQVLASIGASTRIQASDEPITEQLLEQAVTGLLESVDTRHGGFGGAPKFPMASAIEFLLMRGERAAPLQTLRSMAEGGIYDQVGGGFARYAVDATWTVPHFEKMLYDNALLARAYLHGWQVSGEPLLGRVCRETLDWALREMRAPGRMTPAGSDQATLDAERAPLAGGFYAALDADSEGVEGKFYVWSDVELRDALDDQYDEAVAYFKPHEFEHGLILEGRGPEPERLPEIRCKLYGVRAERVRPGTDDKQLTSWNALMISALAEAGAVLGHEPYVTAATECAEFLLARRRGADGRLLRTDKIAGLLEDHAYLVQALTTLYEATFDPRWYHEAVVLADQMIDRFSDSERGGFFTTPADMPQAFARRKDLEDSPIPSGNSAAAYGLLRLALLSGEARYETHALGVLRLLAPIVARYPLAFGHVLQAFDFYLSRVREVAIVGPDPQELLSVVRGAYRPHLVLAAGERAPTASDSEPSVTVPLLADRMAIDGHAAAYVCEHFVCQAPVTTPEELEAAL
jgi:uncharacterized protein